MKEKHKKMAKLIFGLTGIIIVCCLIVSSIILYLAEPGSYLSEEIISSEQGASIYNAQTLLSEIRNGETEVFTEIELDTELNFPEENINNNIFTDEELYEIAQYFFITKWDDDISDWRLTKIYYRLYDCRKGFDGPYSVEYVYEKKISVDGYKYVNVREVGIAEWKNYIGWSDRVEHRSNLSKSIIWEKINYQAKDVYNIVKENGGLDISTKSENECNNIFFELYNNDQGWIITYNGYLGKDLLDLRIDTRTGKIKK